MDESVAMFVNYYYIAYVIFALPLNFLLIFLIWFKSPVSFSAYRLLLLYTSISETFLIVFSFLLQMRIISAGESVALVPYGPLRHASPVIAFIGYNFYNLFLCTTNLSILLSMYYRYSLICHGKCENLALSRNFGVTLVISVGMLVAILIPPYDFPTVTLNTERSYPNYHLLDTFGEYGGFKSTTRLVYLINTTILMGIPYMMPVFILYWRHQIFNQINEVQTHLSERTKKSSLDLVRALTMQAMFPMVCLLPNVAYFLVAQRIHIEFEIAEFVPFPTCVIPCLIDPILTIYYVAPYRSFVTRRQRSVSIGVTLSVAQSSARTI
ncbi:Serpentine Receptor, class D (delta) [Caenorhabditis elegans]|uniref:Serpentine Receptor, class D (Delta) n=1 Tax=Caenorhabditis elegans TaxID=6239 RepID=Q9XVD3_CAEEL|nr:Serpentine Receptor, class D (delta) [Caenorhabditis elegans]CAB03911.1 Serpentine Receptor, class D (delta) [Caenorhabditis elegans]|eukprot:NP_499525.1 Serpentine Receptor, class D (delta) [Caenorhabditis elegans]